jgi:hypothetical protein
MTELVQSSRIYWKIPAQRFVITMVLVGSLFLLGACKERYRVGDFVLVEWEGAEYPAYITVYESPGRYRVHYDGYDVIWDESVPATRIHGKVTGIAPRPQPPAKVLRSMGTTRKSAKSTFKEGDKVSVDWKNLYYNATIIGVLGNEQYRVHYDGMDSNWDEDVDLSRIKRK